MNLKGCWIYIALAAVLAILAILIMEFNGRMAEWRRLSQQEEQVEVTATMLVETKVGLETRIAFATSEAGVQEWTYLDGKWVRTNEILIVPLPQADSTPSPTPMPTVTPRAVSNWELWLAMFFGPIAP
jgi:hypothetical protein